MFAWKGFKEKARLEKIDWRKCQILKRIIVIKGKCYWRQDCHDNEGEKSLHLKWNNIGLYKFG